jgi:spore coat polysaccharide biosynthesis protein SpsF
MKVVIISQARMTSTRLPGKVLKKIGGKSLLEYQIERLKKSLRADDVVIATTTNESDLPIVNLCEHLKISYYRGSETDVLSRYYKAAKEFKADVVVRVTSDCPVIDHRVVDSVIDLFLKNYPDFEYVSNTQQRTFPRGMDTEVFSIQVLEDAYNEATAKSDREHVTPFIHRQKGRYRLGGMIYTENESLHRWTVDTEEDLKLVSKIINALYPIKADFSLEDILRLLKKKTKWSMINAHVEQKKIGE